VSPPAPAKNDALRRSTLPPPRASSVGATGSSHDESDEASQSSGDSSASEEGPYADLIQFGSRICWVTDSAGVKWPVYDRLTNKELKDIPDRKMPTSGKKELMIGRLENKDKRTHAYRESLAKALASPALEEMTRLLIGTMPIWRVSLATSTLHVSAPPLLTPLPLLQRPSLVPMFLKAPSVRSLSLPVPTARASPPLLLRSRAPRLTKTFAKWM
jgi:hypothetical protein